MTKYEAAAAALRKQADKEIAGLNFFMQGPARAAMTDERLANYARIAIDAAERVEHPK